MCVHACVHVCALHVYVCICACTVCMQCVYGSVRVGPCLAPLDTLVMLAELLVI